MDLISRIALHFEDSAQTAMASAEMLAIPISDAVSLMVQSLMSNGKILACGVGGSAANAQHFASELVGHFERERPELAAIALTADTATLTALATDYGLDQVFAKQVRAFGQPGDVLLAISSGGNTASIAEAVEAAHERDLRVVALTGKDGGLIGSALKNGDVHICVPHSRTARIQEVHSLAIHCICDGIDCMLMGEEP